MEGASKILIVEDSVTTCLYMAETLQEAGYTVITAFGGREGMQRVFQEHPQCLVLDIILPDLNGFEICRQLRANDAQRKLPIIMVSSKGSSSDQHWGLRLGANRYLPKPFAGEKLVQAVNELIPRRLQPLTSPRMMAVRPRSEAGSVNFYALIPRRRQDDGLLVSSNPHASVITNPFARYLYTVIDGRRTIEKLCAITGMGREEITRTLQLLQKQRRIEFYDAHGTLVNAAKIFPEHR